MTLLQQYNALTALLIVWEPHHELLYDHIVNTRWRLREILERARREGWDSVTTEEAP